MAVSNALDLTSIWLFSACSVSELRRIRNLLDEVEVPEGKLLVEEGRVGLECYLIVSGQAAVRRRGRKVATLNPGGIFGELALLDRKPRPASIVSETDMDVLVLSQRQFNALFESASCIARKLLSAMAARLREADAKAFDRPSRLSDVSPPRSAPSPAPRPESRSPRRRRPTTIDSSRRWDTSRTRTSSTLSWAPTVSSSVCS